MIDDLSHFATCSVWSTGLPGSCDCSGMRPWRVRKDPGELFAWRIWRLTGDAVYEPMMGCSTWLGAMSLIEQLIWLRNNALQKETNV